MSKVVFQSRMSYKIVESKWPVTREAFHDFDAAKLAGMTPAEIDGLAKDTRVIRNRRKLEAVVSNAQTLLQIEVEFSGFQAYFRSHGDFPSLVKDLRRRLKFLGEMGLLLLPALGWRGSPAPRKVASQSQKTMICLVNKGK